MDDSERERELRRNGARSTISGGTFDVDRKRHALEDDRAARWRSRRFGITRPRPRVVQQVKLLKTDGRAVRSASAHAFGARSS